MTEYDRLVEQTKETAKNFGGLVYLLLVVKQGQAQKIVFRDAAFYIDGYKVDAGRVQKELTRVELRIGAVIVSYNEKLWSGEWTLDRWRKEMSRLAENSHLLFAALALGGISEAARDAADNAGPTTRVGTGSQLRSVGRRIARDRAALERFAKAIQRKQVPSLALAQNRGRAYLRSFYVTYQVLSYKAHVLAGFTEAKNVLTPAEHCHTKDSKEGCYELALKGWVPILTMPPVGTRVCGQFDKCFLLYR